LFILWTCCKVMQPLSKASIGWALGQNVASAPITEANHPNTNNNKARTAQNQTNLMVEVFFELDSSEGHAIDPVARKCVNHLSNGDSAFHSHTFLQQLNHTRAHSTSHITTVNHLIDISVIKTRSTQSMLAVLFLLAWGMRRGGGRLWAEAFNRSSAQPVTHTTACAFWHNAEVGTCMCSEQSLSSFF